MSSVTATISGRVKGDTELLAIEVTAELYDRYREVRTRATISQDEMMWAITADGRYPLTEWRVKRTLAQLERQLNEKEKLGMPSKRGEQEAGQIQA